MSPTAPVPDKQRVAFGLALSKYLGIDPARFVMTGWEAGGGDAHVDLRAFLPEEDLMFMFNNGEVPPS